MAGRNNQLKRRAAQELRREIRSSAGQGKKKKALLLIAAGILLALFSGRSLSPYLSELSGLYGTEAGSTFGTDGGQASYGKADGTDAAAFGAEKTAAVEEAKLLKVVDGDTIRVELNGQTEKVRLLQINAPESVHADAKKNNRFGREASAHLKELLQDTDTVWMTRDASDRDQYGRMLRMIWVQKPADPFSEEELREYCMNAKMILDGYAQVVVFDDVSYEDLFNRFLKESKKEKRGLWADPEWKKFLRYQL